MATALQLTTQEWQAYRPRLKKSPDGMSRVQESRDLLDLARKFGRRIADEFGAKRVFLFGSLARESDFQPDSDIDLAVEGLQGSEYWEVWRIAEEYFPKHAVEVVEIETASQSMKQAIKNSGIEL